MPFFFRKKLKEEDLLDAAKDGDADKVLRCLAAGVSVNCKDAGLLVLQRGRTPLHEAARNGHKEVAGLLLDGGAAVDAVNKHVETPLHEAAQAGHQEVAGLLLRAGAAVDAVCDYGRTPLHWAACLGRNEVAGLLLDAGAALDAADRDGATPLHKAAYNGKKELVGLLLGAGAAVDAVDKEGRTPACVCCKRHNADKANKGAIRAALTAAAATKAAPKQQQQQQQKALAVVPVPPAGKPRSQNWPVRAAAPSLYGGGTLAAPSVMAADLVEAAERGDAGKVRRCLAAGVSANCKMPFGAAVLHVAVYNGSKEVVELLLGAGAAVDTAAESGHTPLHFAAAKGLVEVVELLLGVGAAVDATANDGQTPLHWAAAYGQKEVVELLLGAGADMDAADEEGKTPAGVCCNAGDADKANKGAILAALAAAAAAPRVAPASRLSLRDLCVSESNQEPACDKDWRDKLYQGVVSNAYKWDVFISHAGRDADKPLALELWDLLAEPGVGLRVFLDERSLRRGEDAEPQMADAMKSSRVGLLLLSPEFFERTATRWELEVLFQRKGNKHIDLLPVFLRTTVEECDAQLHAIFPGWPLAFPVGIRHDEEPSARKVHAKKLLAATVQEIVETVCEKCCGDNWEQRYDAGLRKYYQRNQG